MHKYLLDSLDLPDGLKQLSSKETRKLAHEVRSLIIDVVSSNGGHLAPSLGVVDLTIALLSVFNVPDDKIVWDVGHQCYAYKILTDRLEKFHTLRKLNGISGFPKPEESPYDAFATGHASTAISAALGIAQARDLASERYKVVAVVGDGALGGGMCWEAINNAGASKADLLVILNDNKMSIAPSTGALAAHIARIRTEPLYRTVESRAHRFFRSLPLGGGLIAKTGEAIKHGMTSWVSPTNGTIFEALGFEYLGPINGHDISQLKFFLSQAREMSGPVLLHVVTTKGKGYFLAEHDSRHYHGVGPFNTSNGKKTGKSGRSYTDVFSDALMDIAHKDPKVVAITAAMPDGTGLTAFAKKYPKRYFNVGIAEQHAVTFAAGLASAGAKPIVAVYSTFAQRAYDQILHDVCMQNLPVIFALDRAGIVGEDGPTHHGVFDISYMRSIPNLTIMAPKDASELPDMLHFAVEMGTPVAIRYPKGEALGEENSDSNPIKIGKAEMIRDGNDIAFIAAGNVVNSALQAADELQRRGIYARVINARFVKPLDEAMIVSAALECGSIVIAEENVISGGFCSAVLECLAANNALPKNVETVALPDCFIAHGKASDIRTQQGIDKQGILNAADKLLIKSGATAKSL